MLKEGEELVKRTGLLVKIVMLIISAGEISVVRIVKHIPIYWKDLQTNLQYLSSPPSINPKTGRNLQVQNSVNYTFLAESTPDGIMHL